MSGLIALVFPGQGSQSVGMGFELSQAYAIAQQTFSEADDLLGFSISKLAWQGPAEQLNDTVYTQPALLTHSIAALRVLFELKPELVVSFTAGHSVGQISALVAAGALSFPSAINLVRIRGELMKLAGQRNPGGMAAIMGLDLTALEQVCKDASTADEKVEIANDNCPGQVVISGANPAVERAIALAQQAGARRARNLAVSIAAHSSLMVGAQDEFNQALHQTSIVDPRIPVISNVTAQPIVDAAQVRTDLHAQLTSRVRWTESIQYIIHQGVSKIIEIGPGNVLTGLQKRIDDAIQGLSFAAPPDLDKGIQDL